MSVSVRGRCQGGIHVRCFHRGGPGVRHSRRRPGGEGCGGQRDVEADVPFVGAVALLVHLTGNSGTPLLPLMGEVALDEAALHDHRAAALGHGLQPPPSDHGPRGTLGTRGILIQVAGGRHHMITSGDGSFDSSGDAAMVATGRTSVRT